MTVAELPRCVCGEEVAVPHVECWALLTPDEQRRWNGKAFIRESEVED